MAPSGSTISDLEDAVLKGFYGYAIPSIWQAASIAPFILNSGKACDYIWPSGDCGPSGGSGCDSDTTNPIYNYVTDAGATANACWKDNNLYYLVYPPDDAGKNPRFDELPGASDLAVDANRTTTWGSVTIEDIILGSLRSYESNGNKVGGFCSATQP